VSGNALGYQDAVICQLHVTSFCDSSDDGIGGFKGLTSRLDDLQELGVDCRWCGVPIYPSPFRVDGYDIADYYSIHPSCGTPDDCRGILDAAHRRGLRVITELVRNHTSDRHPWFKEARCHGWWSPSPFWPSAWWSRTSRGGQRCSLRSVPGWLHPRLIGGGSLARRLFEQLFPERPTADPDRVSHL
jgi:glycosidase